MALHDPDFPLPGPRPAKSSSFVSQRPLLPVAFPGLLVCDPSPERPEGVETLRVHRPPQKELGHASLRQKAAGSADPLSYLP